MDTLAQKHLTVWNYVNDPLIFALSRTVMNSFTPADQALVRECAVEAGRFQTELTRRGLGLDGGDDASMRDLRARGVEVTVLTDAEKQAFARVTRPVYERWSATIGAELVRKAEAAVR